MAKKPEEIEREEEHFMQAMPIGKDITSLLPIGHGIFGIRASKGEYLAFFYLLKGDAAILCGKEKFAGKNETENYTRFQEYTETRLGSPASRYEGRIFSGELGNALNQMARNHYQSD